MQKMPRMMARHTMGTALIVHPQTTQNEHVQMEIQVLILRSRRSCKEMFQLMRKCMKLQTKTTVLTPLTQVLMTETALPYYFQPQSQGAWNFESISCGFSDSEPKEWRRP